MRDWTLSVEDLGDPDPGPGQALTRVLACGICGSDLHMLQHGARQMVLGEELSAFDPPDQVRPVRMDPAGPVVMGHEFCCEVLAVGPGCTNLREGDVVVSMPVAFDAAGVHALCYSGTYSGGYADRLVLNDAIALKVPNGCSPDLAALTEPYAVGVHAVAKSGIAVGDAALVLGCGPVGLAVIADLRRLGIGPIVASDFSPARRALAARLGAHEVVDPREVRPIDAWRRVDGNRPLVIFEAVGVPGMIDQAMLMAPRGSRVVVVGVCMEDDRIRPMAGIRGELSVQFVLAYTPEEFALALHCIAQGEADVAPLVTGTVGVDGVPLAFRELGNPENHAKILVRPGGPSDHVDGLALAPQVTS
jgi:threonine dehydrogenase-like Zn-dependent dehydrogenase